MSIRFKAKLFVVVATAIVFVSIALVSCCFPSLVETQPFKPDPEMEAQMHEVMQGEIYEADIASGSWFEAGVDIPAGAYLFCCKAVDNAPPGYIGITEQHGSSVTHGGTDMLGITSNWALMEVRQGEILYADNVWFCLESDCLPVPNYIYCANGREGVSVAELIENEPTVGVEVEAQAEERDSSEDREMIMVGIVIAIVLFSVVMLYAVPKRSRKSRNFLYDDTVRKWRDDAQAYLTDWEYVDRYENYYYDPDKPY